MNKVIITSQSTVVSQREIELPAFFRNRITGQCVGIKQPGRHISIHNTDVCRSIGDYSWYPELTEEKFEQISEDLFNAALNECAYELTKDATTTGATA